MARQAAQMCSPPGHRSVCGIQFNALLCSRMYALMRAMASRLSSLGL